MLLGFLHTAWLFSDLFLQPDKFFGNLSPYTTMIGFAICFNPIKQCIESFHALISPSLAQFKSFVFLGTHGGSNLCILWQLPIYYITDAQLNKLT